MDGFGPNTTAIWAACDPEQWKDWDLMPPISTSAIYKETAPGQIKRYGYSRFGNPTRAILEEALATMDHGKYGLVFSSGSAAIVSAVHLLNAGDHIVAADDLFSGTMIYFTKIVSRMNIKTTFVDGTIPKNIVEAMRPNTKMIWLEVASNPRLKVVDLKAIVPMVKAKNPDVVIVVDNTFLTPCIIRPLDFGVDVCMMSCSKFINGHHDIIMGCLTMIREDLHKRLMFLQAMLGAVPGAPDCYQVIRSLKTLPLRMQRHHENGLIVAQFLATQPNILHLNCPLLQSHPQYELTQQQQKGRHSGVVSFLLAGTVEHAHAFIKSLKVILLATSLGGTQTSITVPGSMIGEDILDDELQRLLDLRPNFVRLSVGLEDVKDIIEDLKQAFEKAYQ